MVRKRGNREKQGNFQKVRRKKNAIRKSKEDFEKLEKKIDK